MQRTTKAARIVVNDARLVNEDARLHAAFDVTATPPMGTLERWAYDYVRSTDLATKLAPPPPPEEMARDRVSLRLAAPGRPAGFTTTARAKKSPGPVALRDPKRRAELLHTFFHHELQAAELMAWAILAYPEPDRSFHRGLARILLDETRHMRMYAERIEALGSRIGDFPVRDWFWERVPRAESAASFVAFLGVGLEGANLDHAPRFAAMLREAGDEESARVEERVGREEIPHVRFALRWLEKLAPGADFAAWCALLPPPISPILLRGPTIDANARTEAGMSAEMIRGITEYACAPRGS